MKILRRGSIVLLMMSIAPYANAGALCGYGEGGAPGGDFPASPIAIYQMKNVEDILCERFNCPNYSFAQSYTTQNAMAWSDGYSSSIRYNPDFMNKVFYQFGFSANGAIFAHELGHIIDFNEGENFTRYELERRADEYAGCAFALIGHPEKDLTPFAQTLLSMPSTSEYPTPIERVQAVKDGYEKCK